MKAMETACCVVTVFESLEKYVDNGQPYNSGETPGRPTQKRLSCSGAVLNNRTGIVLCSGLVFSRFLTNKESVSSDCHFLLPHSFSNKIQIYIQQPMHPGHARNYCRGTPDSSEANNKLYSLNAELIMLVNCLEFQAAFLKMFKGVDKWSFYTGEEDGELIKDSEFLSWFAVLRAPGLVKPESGGSVLCVSSCRLEKGLEVYACGCPFGSFCPDIFVSTVSKGIVSNIAGEDHAVILTDARCLPGTEGGGLFLKQGGNTFLVGLIVSPLCWKSGEWIGLTLVCSLNLILKNVVQFMKLQTPLKGLSAQLADDALPGKSQCSKQHFPTVALVESGQFWGSGILISSQLLLTCRHVLNGKSIVTVKFKTNKRFFAVTGEVLYATEGSSAYDVAVVQLKEHLPDTVVPALASCFKPGEDVYVISYGVFGQSCGPSVTSGILSRAITCHSQPVMLQTTCAVQAGSSGGAVVRADTGELLGLVSSNTRDFVAEITYPHLNFSVPITVLEPLLRRFALTGNSIVFQELDTASDEVKRVWRLQASPRQHLTSKL